MTRKLIHRNIIDCVYGGQITMNSPDKTMSEIVTFKRSKDLFKESILIDKLIASVATNGAQEEIKPHGWFHAKPLDYTVWWRNIYVAWRVLIGKSFAVHYKRDEL